VAGVEVVMAGGAPQAATATGDGQVESIALSTNLERSVGASRALFAVLVILAAAVPYLNTLTGGFVFDDHTVVPTDPRLLFSWGWLAPPSITGSLYRPVTMLSYAIDAASSPGPSGYHATNVFLHVLASLAAFALASRLLARPWLAAVAATLFAVHPVHTEAVANLAGRAELLAGLFVLVALWAALRASEDDADRRWLALVFVAALFGVGSKESALVLPLLTVVLCAWHRRRLDAGGLIAAAVVSVPCILLVAARAVVVGSIGFHEAIPFVDNPLAYVDPARRVATALVVLFDYVGLSMLPLRLSADDTFDQVPVVESAADPRLIVAIAALTLVGVAVWRGRRRVPAAWLGFVFFFAALAVTANVFFPIGTIKAERFLYVPSFGWCLAAAGLAALEPRIGARVVLALVLLFAVRTWVRNDDWHDDYRLFTTTVIASPQSVRAHSNAGAVHAQRGEFDVALEHYTRATEIRPEFAQAQLGRGKVLEIVGRQGEAVVAYAAAREADPTNLETLLRSGDLLVATAAPADAERIYRTGLVIQPHHPELILGLALTRALQGDRTEAKALRAQIDARIRGFGSLPTRLDLLAKALQN
jgi:protein O-mannosyl-transferase